MTHAPVPSCTISTAVRACCCPTTWRSSSPGGPTPSAPTPSGPTPRPPTSQVFHFLCAWTTARPTGYRCVSGAKQALRIAPRPSTRCGCGTRASSGPVGPGWSSPMRCATWAMAPGDGQSGCAAHLSSSMSTAPAVISEAPRHSRKVREETHRPLGPRHTSDTSATHRPAHLGLGHQTHGIHRPIGPQHTSDTSATPHLGHTSVMTHLGLWWHWGEGAWTRCTRVAPRGPPAAPGNAAATDPHVAPPPTHEGGGQAGRPVRCATWATHAPSDGAQHGCAVEARVWPSRSMNRHHRT